MIYLYTGTPGSYKSYHATADIIYYLRLGYNVIANFPVDYTKIGLKPRGKFVFIKNSDVSVDFFLNFARENHHRGYKPQTLVYLDESGVLFNARQFNDKRRMEWINFFANHRHFNYDFTLITQMDMMIDKQIRGLVETEIRHRALKNYKIMGRLINFIFHGCYMAVEMWYPCKLKTGADFKIFRQKIANCYDTMALFIDDKSENKSKNNGKKNETGATKNEKIGSARSRVKRKSAGGASINTQNVNDDNINNIDSGIDANDDNDESNTRSRSGSS